MSLTRLPLNKLLIKFRGLQSQPHRWCILQHNRTAVAYKFFAYSSSHEIFLMMQKTLGLKVKEIGQPSDTRWACRWKSVEAVKSNYAAVVKSLVELPDPLIRLVQRRQLVSACTFRRRSSWFHWLFSKISNRCFSSRRYSSYICNHWKSQFIAEGSLARCKLTRLSMFLRHKQRFASFEWDYWFSNTVCGWTH